eukprot:jgi/Chrzof1/7001/Cz02g07070.t1_UROS
MELKDITQDNITTLIARLLTNDRHLQRKTIEEFVDDNVEFTHILGKVQGKAAFYYIYRLATVSWDYRFEVVDFIKQDDVERPKIAVWLNLGIKVPPFYLLRYTFPTIAILHFKRSEDGKYRIIRQYDHHSLYVFLWIFGWPWMSISQMIMLPMAGVLLSTVGKVVDSISEATENVQYTISGLKDQVLELINN